MQLDKGTLLIAHPEIDDPLFQKSVVLLCDHSTIGSFGLIINKPIEASLPDELLSPSEMLNPAVHLRAGGSLQKTQMMLLHNASIQGKETLQVCPGVFLGGDVDFLKESASQSQGPAILICFGFCGWMAGELENECSNQRWLPYPAKKEYVFNVSPKLLWNHLLKDLGGKYAYYSMMPEDLSQN